MTMGFCKVVRVDSSTFRGGFPSIWEQGRTPVNPGIPLNLGVLKTGEELAKAEPAPPPTRDIYTQAHAGAGFHPVFSPPHPANPRF